MAPEIWDIPYYYDDQIKEDAMGKICSMHKHFGWKA